MIRRDEIRRGGSWRPSLGAFADGGGVWLRVWAPVSAITAAAIVGEITATGTV